MLTLILADAELELVPDRLKGHRGVSAPARGRGKRTGKTLLNASRHHHAMQAVQLPERERRGRPDITHVFLLTALDSALNLEGGLRTLVHTRNDEMITVAPETRIMRDQERFEGLMEQLFESGQVGPRDREPLMTLAPDVTLEQALAFQRPDHVVVLDEGGQRVDLYEAAAPVAQAHDHVAVVLGGFPKGEWRSDVAKVADERWSLHDQRLSAWVAAAEVLVPWRHATAGMERHRGEPPGR